MIAAISTFLPALILSDFIFPIDNMPVVIQWLTYLDPLRYCLIIVRGIFLKGSGWQLLWPQIAGMLILGVCLMGLAVSRFRKTLE